MATSISLSSDNYPQPECDQASCCYWFEKIGPATASCANRHHVICHKRRDDIFAPHEREKTQSE
ncbi:MAG: hypothetical protein LBP55_05700 [Candidatus Adiutrix sp.]|jgi:hypothetical protein|nr:hypothetical protein [Candidatus Adiutrix sp.]